MDALTPENPPVTLMPAQLPPRVWKFWGTALWGLFIFAGMFVGQAAVIAFLVLKQGGPFDMATAIHVVAGGLTISLSVIMGLPAVLAAAWPTNMPPKMNSPHSAVPQNFQTRGGRWPGAAVTGGYSGVRASISRLSIDRPYPVVVPPLRGHTLLCPARKLRTWMAGTFIPRCALRCWYSKTRFALLPAVTVNKAFTAVPVPRER